LFAHGMGGNLMSKLAAVLAMESGV
jgi:hypothetical protein